MYPFNRAVSLTVDEDGVQGSNGQNTNGDLYMNGGTTPQSKTIVGTILEMKNNEDKWVEGLRLEREGVVGQCTWRGVTCISRCLRHVLIFLRVLCLFPGIYRRRRGHKRNLPRVMTYIFLFNLSTLAVVANAYFMNMNIWLITAYKTRFGLMHASTVSCIICGIKPMVNAFVIILFALRVREHLRLIKTLDTVDVCFRSAFNLSPPIKRYKIVFFVLVAIAFTIPFTFRIVEFILTTQSFGQGFISDTAFLTVPLLTLWNIIPLLYYDMYNRIVRFYCRTLIKSMNKEHKKRHFSLKFYYEQFLRVTNVQEAVGNLFNPFVLFSLAWSMLILCLTIYFITQPHSSLLEPITPEQIVMPALRHRLNLNVHFTILWAGLQVIVALLHITIICSTGMATNETTRSIVNAVLRIVPDANADLDRFQISCFVHKMSTQFMWGMTVWRAFPLERTTFFTLVSVIVTYSFLLLKLKDNPAVMPITRSFIIHNGTSYATTSP